VFLLPAIPGHTGIEIHQQVYEHPLVPGTAIFIYGDPHKEWIK
jgi:hypothetical protein